MIGVGYRSPTGIADEVFQMAKIEVREGDTLVIKVRVARVSDDGEKFTIEVAGQRYTGTGIGLDIVKHEKGANWPG